VDFQISVDIAAPPYVVWPVMAEAERWHEWTADRRTLRATEDSGSLDRCALGGSRSGRLARFDQPSKEKAGTASSWRWWP
jgi:uncharacterized protein YndB with AHSA1/START domain